MFKRTVFAIIAVLASGGISFLIPTSGRAATASITLINLAEDYFWNYDFTQQVESGNNVDWPVDLIFMNNATINKAKNGTGWFVPGGTIYGRIDDGQGGVWDGDAGVKPDCVGWGENPHIRLYADGDDYLKNMHWGNYVIATAHKDVNECGGGNTRFGWNDNAEWETLQRVQSWSGWSYSLSAIYLWNNNSATQGNHYFQSDGYASYIHVP